MELLKGRKMRTHAAAALDQEAPLMDEPRPFATDASSNARLPAPGIIGFVGLGRMGTAMAANLAAVERQVIAYVHHPERTHS